MNYFQENPLLSKKQRNCRNECGGDDKPAISAFGHEFDDLDPGQGTQGNGWQKNQIKAQGFERNIMPAPYLQG